MKVFILFLVVFSANSYAQRASSGGGMGSGGGSGVVCFSSIEVTNIVKKSGGVVADKYIKDIQALQSLDLQLAFMKKGVDGKSPNLYLAKKDQTVKSYLDELLLRLNHRRPELFHAIKLKLENLEENIYYRINPLLRVLDENDVGSEDSDYCTLTTFATQYEVDGETIIHLDERIFLHPKHSVSSKGVLLLHEYIYSVLRTEGDTDSRRVRKIVQDVLED